MILVHVERFLVPKNQLIKKKNYQSNRFLNKNYGSGGRPKIFLKSHNFAHTRRIEKRFSVFCSSSDALSEDIRFHSKS